MDNRLVVCVFLMVHFLLDSSTYAYHHSGYHTKNNMTSIVKLLSYLTSKLDLFQF